MDTAHTNHTPSVSAADGHPHKSKSSSRGGGCTLGEEAAVLAPLMSRWRAAVTPLHDYDLAGAFILSSLALRRPKAFLSSRLKPAVTCEGELCKASLPIGQFEGLLELMGYDFIKRKCCSPTATSTSTSCHIDEDPRDIPIAVIFNRHTFDISSFVIPLHNAHKHSTYTLLYVIPSSIRRCSTMR